MSNFYKLATRLLGARQTVDRTTRTDYTHDVVNEVGNFKIM